eukprot:scaffold254709_cov23-Prasinocladus_malaysianus.AAC.1
MSLMTSYDVLSKLSRASKAARGRTTYVKMRSLHKLMFRRTLAALQFSLLRFVRFARQRQIDRHAADL